MSLEVVDTFTPYYSGRQPTVQRLERQRRLTDSKRVAVPAQPADPEPKQGEEARQ